MKEFYNNHVTKRDLIYVLVILLEFNVLYLLRDQLGASEVVNVISIGAGAASIFLAVVATGFSFNQAAEATRQNESITASITEMKSKVHELSQVKEDLMKIRDEVITLRGETETGFKEIKKLPVFHISNDPSNESNTFNFPNSNNDSVSNGNSRMWLKFKLRSSNLMSNKELNSINKFIWNYLGYGSVNYIVNDMTAQSEDRFEVSLAQPLSEEKINDFIDDLAVFFERNMPYVSIAEVK